MSIIHALDPMTDAQTAAAWVDAIEAERQKLIQHIPMRAGAASTIRAAMLRLKAQTALMEARCQRYADSNACLRCDRVPRAPGLVYCVECGAPPQSSTRSPTCRRSRR